MVADDEGFDSLLERAKLQMAGRTFFTWKKIQIKKDGQNVWFHHDRTLILQEPDLGGESRSVLFKDFAQVLLGEPRRSVVEVEDFARRLESIFRGHVRVEEAVVLAVDVTLEGRRPVRQVVRHRHVRQKGLFGITGNKTEK